MSLFAELKRRNVVRVAAAYVVTSWLVIQVVETLFPVFDLSDEAIRVVVIVLAIGLIPAVILAWAFEITPEGLKLERNVDRNQSITPHTSKKLDRIIIVVLAVALTYFAFDKFVLSESREASIAESALQRGRSEALTESYGDKSIAVMPFVNMSDEASNEFFSDGISEELLNLLAKIPELRVISRSSAFSYKGKDIKLTQVADELNVTHILEGSVRKAGNQVRITAQLIEARSDTHLWSETYDRTLHDVFAIQDEIAAMVVAQMKISLLGEAPQVTVTDPTAYGLFLQARELGRQYSADGMAKAIALLQQALVIDPNYAVAWKSLAGNYMNQADIGLRPKAEGYTLARNAVEMALSIDSDYAAAHDGLGWIAMSYDLDPSAAARHYQMALQLDPTNPSIIVNAAVLLTDLGRLDAAIAAYEYAIPRDPLSPIKHSNLGQIYFMTGQWAKAIEFSRAALRLSPDHIGAHYVIGLALLFQGDAKAAFAEFQKEPDDMWRIKGSALALYSQERETGYRKKLEEMIERWGDRWPAEIADVYAYSGDVDEAFRWLEKSIVEHGGFSQISVFLKPLNDDPRWLPIMESNDTLPAQLDAIKFNLVLPQ